MATTIVQVDGGTAINGTADDDFIVAVHVTGAGVADPQVITGGNGDDVIFGDHDKVTVDTLTGNASIETAVSIDDIQKWGQRENPDVTDATQVPYTTVLGIGSGELDFFSVTVGAGEIITVDLDYGFTDDSGSGNLSIDLFQIDGSSLDFSDGASDTLGENGSSEAGGNDPFVTFTNTTGSSQVYFIRIADTGPLAEVPLGMSYMLNVSVTNHAMSDFATFGNDDISGGDGDDVLYGVEGNDILDGGDGNDVLRGGTGNDVLRDTTSSVATGQPGVADDILDGGDGDDILEANFGTDQFIGGAGIDTLQIAGSIVDTSFGGPFDFDIDLEAGSDTFGNTYFGIENINGGAGNDTIVGDAEANVINGGDGNDIISDSGGGDTINLGAGDDTYLARLGLPDFSSPLDRIDGGTGIDTFVMEANYSRDVVFDMEEGNYFRIGNFGSSIVTNFENFRSAPSVFSDPDAYDVKGTAGVNIITGGDGDDTIEGRGGADILDGGAGIDTLSYSSSDAGVSVSLEINSVGGGHATGDSISNFENVTGSAFNDDLIGDDTDTILIGGAGNDRLKGLGGRDEMYGGEDDDLLRAGNTPADVVAGEIYDGGAGFDTIRVENASSTDFTTDLRDVTLTDLERLSFFITGSTSAPGIRVAQLNAAQAIGSGIQEIEAVGRGLASATFNTEVFMDDATSVDLSDLTFVGGYGTDAADTITIIGDGDDESIIGTSITDIINAGGGHDTIEGGAGSDFLDGGDGIDTLSYASSGAGVSVFLFSGTAQGGDATGDTHVDFENIIGTDFGDGLAGDNGDNILRGGGGNDTLYHGGVGADQFFGEDGDDTIDLDRSNDMSAGDIYDGGAGFDTLETSGLGFGDYDLRSASLVDIEQLAVVGEVDFPGEPGSAADVSVTLNVAQAIFSGLTDVLFVPDDSADVAVEFVMDAATSVDLSGLSISGAGSVGRLIITGDGDNETIRGSSIRDDISGGAGDDVLIGAAGADVLDGGAGIDAVDYRNSAAGVALQLNASATGIGGDAQGDVLIGIENIIGSEFDDALVAGSGANQFEGLGGDDEFGLFTFDDGAGNIFDGGAGTDELELFQFGASGFIDLTDDTLISIEELDIFGNGSATVVDTVRLSAAQASAFDKISAGGHAGQTVTLDIEMGALFDFNATTAFTLTGFTEPGDTLRISGDDDGEFIIGHAGRDVIVTRGGEDLVVYTGGEDEIFLGDASDRLDITASAEFGTVFDGGAGTDALFVNEAGVFDLRPASITGFENLGFGSGADIDRTLKINGSQALEFVQIDGGEGTNSSEILEIHQDLAGDLDLSGLTFRDWGFGTGTQDALVRIFLLPASVINEVIRGTSQDDEFISAGGDILHGRGGDDVVRHTNGLVFDTFDGGIGTDTVDYSDEVVRAVRVDLQAGTVSGLSGSVEASLTAVENVTGSQLNDVITGDTADNVLQGEAGNDTIDAGEGSDTVLAGIGDDTVIDSQSADFADAYDGGDGFDTIDMTAEQWGPDMLIDLMAGEQRIGEGFATVVDTLTNFEAVVVNGRAQIRGDDGDNRLEAITGSGAGGPGSFANIIDGEGGNDFIASGDDDDVVTGGSGNDQIFGGDGNDLLAGNAGDDLLDGGAGVDTVSYAEANGAVAVFLNRTDDVGGGEGVDTFVSIENVIGTDFDDRINGNSADNHLMGGLGDDVLVGLAGNDTLDGGAGNDELTGSGGDDVLIGGDGDDRMFGSGGADTFDGGAGNDLIEGGLGVDFIDGGDGNDEIFGLFGVETIFGGAGDDNIRADGSGDFVDGGAGNDRIVGGNGRDILWGGAGNDVLFGGGGGGGSDTLRDVFVFKSIANGGGGFDIIRDFRDTTDKIDLSESGYTSFEEVFADASQAGNNVVINFDFGGIVRIENFDLADLTAGDFLF